MSIAVAERPSTPDVFTEPAYPACQCFECRHPTTDNAVLRADHAYCHASFQLWIAENRPSAFRAPYRDMLRWAIEEGTAPESRNPYGACNRHDCAGKPAHPDNSHA